ncbi:hypothetical protein Daus18300_004053 [Diaporthe australafricana]|uniref:Uncharacterized protein n=1 Tax=Diaporthe australafricana TaxID=127596 RepID=A0ABR3XBD1_9PEZI
MATVKNTPQASPFARLFSSQAQVDSQLQKIRDKIYSFAWSCERRDSAKLGWVLSEYGIDRNIPLRWIGNALSGPNSDSIDEYSWELLLVNKQISADFTRFIYSVDDLDILVDLKAVHNNQNEASFDKIVILLQNANFQRYTKSGRVRIHFPYKYPFQNLPAFNQHALENIARALDNFQQLAHLSVHIVPMQAPQVYELRLATFPFYPMTMTNWRIRTLNSSTYNWDIVGREQLHQLNLAWDTFQANRSLTATAPTSDAAQKSTSHDVQVPPAKKGAGVSTKAMVVQKTWTNGSQKRKGRKLKALSTVTFSDVSRSTSEVPSDAVSSQASSHIPAPSKDGQSATIPDHNLGPEADSSQVKSAGANTSVQKAEKTPSYVSSAQSATASTRPPSSPISPPKPKTTSTVMNTSDFGPNDDVVESDTIDEQGLSVAKHAKHAPEESPQAEQSQMASSSSSTSSSVTLGRDQTEDEAALHATIEETPSVAATIAEVAEADDKGLGEKKKKRNRKKAKKSKVAKTADGLPDCNDAQNRPAEARDKDETDLENTIDAQANNSMRGGDWEGIFLNAKRPFPLAEITDLSPWHDTDNLLTYTRTNGNQGVISRDSDLDRFIRQKERKAAQESERQAERKRMKEKRQAKKMKEVLIRRKEPSDGLRRGLGDTKQPAGSKESDLRKRLGDIAEKCLGEDVPASTTDSSGDFDSNDEDISSPEDVGSSAEEAHHPRHEYPFRHEHFDANDSDAARHCHQLPSYSGSAGSGSPSSTIANMSPNEDRTSENNSQADHQLKWEPGHPGNDHIEKSISNKALLDNQHTMGQFADHSESSNSQFSGEAVASNAASPSQKHQQDHEIEDEH